MDGTLIDSTLAVEGAWASFAETYPHLNVKEILKSEYRDFIAYVKTLGGCVQGLRQERGR